MTLFVMGATGRTGGAVATACAPRMAVRAATRTAEGYDGPGDPVTFDLDAPGSWQAALAGCDAVFVMRPPQNTDGSVWPTLFDAAERAGVTRAVVSSVRGADRNRLLPHRAMEDAARASALEATVLRPADYMQNLQTVHRDALAEGVLRLPAGQGRSAFVDVADVGACAAAVLAEGRGAGGAHELTGPEALDWYEVAGILSDVLSRPVRYEPIGPVRFVLMQRKEGRPLPMGLVMTALYTVQRLGLAAEVTEAVRRLTGRAPTSLRAYAERERAALTIA